MDIAQLGFAIDSSGLVQGGTALDQFAGKAQTAAAAATQVGTAVSQAGGTAASGFAPIAAAATAAAAGIGVIPSAAAKVAPAAQAAGAAGAAGLGLIAPAGIAAGAVVDDLSTRKLFTLQRSLVELGAGIASGASPFGLMAVAAEHTGVILGEGGGLSGVIKQLGAEFAGLITPITIVGASLAAVGAVAIAGYSEWNNSIKTVNAGLEGLATRSDITRDDIVQAAGAATNAWGLSYKEATQAATALASIGTVSKSSLTEGVQDVNALSNALNISTTAAIDLVTKGLSGGIQAVEQLNKQYQFLTPSVEAAYEKQVAAGNQFAASQVILDALGQSLQGAANKSGTLGNAIVNVSTDAVIASGAMVGGFQLQQQKLDSLEQSIRNYSEALHQAAMANGVSDQAMMATDLGLAELNQEYIKLKSSIDTANASAQVRGLQGLATDALSLARSINPLPGTITTLTGRLHDMQTAMQNPAIQQDATAMQTYAGAIDIVQGKLSSLMPIEQQMSLQEAATLQTISARTDSEKILAAGLEARTAAQLKGLPIAAQEQAQMIAETETQAKLGNQWTNFNDKINVQLDAQAYKLELQKEALGGSAAAIQDAALKSQLFDQYLSNALQHGITNFDEIKAGFEAWIAKFGPAISGIGAIKAALDAATASAKALGSAMTTSLSSGYVAGYGGNKQYDPFGGYLTTVNPVANPAPGDTQDFGFEEGGSFIIPGPPSSKDNVMVRFAAAKGERVTITAAHEVARQGFAKGGNFVAGFTDAAGTVITSTPPAHESIDTGHASTKLHVPKLPKVPKAHVTKPKKETKHELALAARNDYGYVGMPGFEDGGEFTVGSHMMVEFPAATGERIAISPAHHPQHGFAGGGQFDIAPGAGLSSSGGGPSGAYAGIHSFAGAGVSSTPGANTSGINAFAAKAPASISPASVGGGGDDLSSIADALQLSSAPSPVASVGVQSSTNTGGTTGAQGGQNFYINVNIAATDLNSFTASSSQIAASLRRAVLSAASHMGP